MMLIIGPIKGMSKRRLAQDQEAIASYDKALEIQPNDEITKNNRQLALEKLSK